jgi:AcrR family transcriptional regulator
LSIHSHKSRGKKVRSVQAPQRANGKLRVAAILEAAAALISEKGYEAATMAEIAVRSGTKIGSLYRFFPNKESIADTIVLSARANLDVVFDKFDARVRALSSPALADDLTSLLFELFTRPAFMELFSGGKDWSIKREEFRSAMLERTAKALMIHSPSLSSKSAADIALVVLLNVKTVVSHQSHFEAEATNVAQEFRDMTRLYLETRLRATA